MKLFLNHDNFVSYVYVLFWEYAKKSDSVADRIVWIYFDGKFELFLPALSQAYDGLRDLNPSGYVEEIKFVCMREFAELSFDDPATNKVFAITIKEKLRLETAIDKAITATILDHYACNAKKTYQKSDLVQYT